MSCSLDSDYFPAQSAELTYTHDYARILAPTDPCGTSTFSSVSNLAGAVLGSNAGSLPQNVNLSQSGF